MMAKLTKLRDEDGIKASTKVVVYDNNTGKTLWMYDLRHGYYSRFMKLPRITSMFQEFPDIFDPHAWFDANNAVGID
jgi:ABC-type Zn uptake system ZnuABC Zn-binding protein ZnuA